MGSSRGAALTPGPGLEVLDLAVACSAFPCFGWRAKCGLMTPRLECCRLLGGLWGCHGKTLSRA